MSRRSRKATPSPRLCRNDRASTMSTKHLNLLAAHSIEFDEQQFDYPALDSAGSALFDR